MINIDELLLGDIAGLRYVVRMSTSKRNHNENVAEHSYYTAIYALVIGMAYNRQVEKEDEIDLAMLQSKALLHDIEECITGDIIRGFKYASPEMRAEIGKEADSLASVLFNNISSDLAPDFYNIWTSAKDDSITGAIVSFSDFISFVAYLHLEIESGNRLIVSSYKELRKRTAPQLEKFKGDRYWFLRPYVPKVEKILDRVAKTLGEPC